MQFHLDVQEDQLKAGKHPGDKGYGEEPESHHGTLTTIENGEPVQKVYKTISPPPTFIQFYKLLREALVDETEPPVKPEDARDVLRIIEAARQSSDEGRTVEL